MKRSVCLDIETIWDQRALPFLPPKGPREKIEPTERYKTDPNFIKPCVVGFCCEGQAWSLGLNDFNPEHAERNLLIAVWDELESADTIVTFSGLSFDIPLLLRRSWYHNVKPTKNIDMRKYYIGNHVDVRAVLSNWDTFAPGKLELYCNLKLGCGKTDGIDGSQVQAMWDEGKHDEIKKYCENDCFITWELYRSLKGWYLPSDGEEF